MKKSNDILTLLDSYKLQFEPIPFTVRSIDKSFPKRFNTSKLLISGLYKTMGSSHVDCKQYFIYAPEERQAFSDLSRFDPITDLIHLDYLPLKQLLNLITTWKTPTSFSIHDHEDYKIGRPLLELAKSIHGIYPNLQSDLGKRYLDKSSKGDLYNQHFPYYDDALVLQERPGKMIVWSPYKAWEQAFTQKYKNIIQENVQKKTPPASLLDVGTSQGYFSMIAWAGHDHPYTIPKTLSAFSYRIDGKGFDMTAPDKIAETVWKYTKSTLPENKEDKLQIYISCPFQTITHALMQSFGKQLAALVPFSFRVHDVLTGYSPKLSFMSFLTSIEEKAGIFLDLQNFPEVVCIIALNEKD